MMTTLKTLPSGPAMVLGRQAFGQDAGLAVDAIRAKLSPAYDAETVAYEAKRGFIGHNDDHFSNFLAQG